MSIDEYDDPLARLEFDQYADLMEPPPGREEVTDLILQERDNARPFEAMFIYPPDDLTDERKRKFEAAGFTVRFSPIGPDRDPKARGPFAVPFSQDLAQPGWHTIPLRPLDRTGIAEMIRTQHSSGPALIEAPPDFEPETVKEFYYAMFFLNATMPPERGGVVRLPTVPELYHFLRTAPDPYLNGDILCRNRDREDGAMAIQFERGEMVGFERYSFDENFLGGVYPMRQLP